ncbi:MAG: hypothetical protein NUV74_01530 [Candidatus Brocadiaceae bacterium]|nr:hypothetical protein [Candidatus Brocadiaceae bacterium]
MKYPKENWDKFIGETSILSTLSEISMDETRGESNETIHNEIYNDDRKKYILSSHQLLENEGTDGPLLLKEELVLFKKELNLFKRIYFHWMNKIILLYCENRRRNVYYCLKNYYINFKDESVIIDRLNSLGYSGNSLLRKNRSRFEKSISQKNTGLLYMMINELNKHFGDHFEYLTKDGLLRKNFGIFCEEVRKLGLLGDES